MRRFAAALAVLLFAPAFPARSGEDSRLTVEVCVTCHSAEAHAHSTIPSLDGRPAGELLRILLAFRDGSRSATIMDRIARGYSQEQLGVMAGELARRSVEGRP